jgi:hypothetical protein
MDAKITVDSLSTKTSTQTARIESRARFNYIAGAARTGQANDASGKIMAKVASNPINKPSNKPLAISLDIDGSGSMLGTHPNRTCVTGAKKFVDKLNQSTLSRTWAISVFTYGVYSSPIDSLNLPIDSLNQTKHSKVFKMLSDFTDNENQLKAAIEKVGSHYLTPTYPSLLEGLHHSQKKRPYASNEKAIVLLSDGLPNRGNALRDSVCREAKRLKSPIYTIGLGPASGLNTDSTGIYGVISDKAVAEMRAIAKWTGGSYAGIDLTNKNATASKLYSHIAVATSVGSMNYKVHLSGSGFASLQPGTILYFTLTLSNSKGKASAAFFFSVPQPK